MEDCNGCCVESAYCSDEEVTDTSVNRSPSPPLSPTCACARKLTWRREEQQVDVVIIGEMHVVSMQTANEFVFFTAYR